MFKAPARHHTARTRRNRPDATDLTADIQYGWVRAQDRVLAVAVHQPPTARRGGTVLLAGSPGRERVTTQRTLVHVARALAAEGWRVVRFDWSGTGLSPCTEETQPARQWAEDLETVRQWAAQAGPVHGVGVRLGGSVMAGSPAAGWASRHIWSPVSGKRWLRHHSGLRRLAGDLLPARETAGTELTGLYLDTEGTAALRGLPEPEQDSAHRVSILAGPGIDALPVDVNPLVASVPLAAASTIAAALGAADVGAASTPASLTPEGTVEISVAGTPVRLRHARVGRDNRPAVITSPLDLKPHAPGLALVSLGSESMEAPGSLWIRTAVTASARGAVCLLAERSDTGELVRPAQLQDSNPYTRAALRESRELLMRLAELTDGPLRASGVCLGGWALVASAHRLPRRVTRRLTLHLVNNLAWQRTPEYYWRQGRRDGIEPQAMLGEDTTQQGEGDAAASPSVKGAVKALVRPVVRGVRNVTSEGPAWAQALGSEVGLVDRPRPLLRRLSRVPGLSVDLVLGPVDAHAARVTHGPLGARSRVTVLDPLDHSLHAAASQRNLFEYLLSQLGSR